MSDKRTGTELLDGAYAIETPSDSVAYYADFAETYDRDFADALGYAYPAEIARAYARHAGPDDVPVADIGCGTGLVAAALGLSPDRIEGFDISPAMLAKARDKGLYAALHEADLTQCVTDGGRFGALVSAGTFTHGHLGPDPLENVLALGRGGALCVIGVNAQHFDAAGFAPVLNRLHAAGRITEPRRETVGIYSRTDTDHGADAAQLLIFRLA